MLWLWICLDTSIYPAGFLRSMFDDRAIAIHVMEVRFLRNPDFIRHDAQFFFGFEHHCFEHHCSCRCAYTLEYIYI